MLSESGKLLDQMRQTFYGRHYMMQQTLGDSNF